MGQALSGVRATTAADGDITVIERLELDPAPVVGITQRSADRASHVGLALLIALNVVDIVLTRRFLALGLDEGNPLMAVAVRSWTAAACKVAILAALAWSFAHRPATATRLALVWTGVGLYVLGAYVNLSAIQAAEALRR
ncbi:MAG: DUF5658 family protein [Acidimicrobiales bacterium]